MQHESYDANANGFPNDIAVIRLSTPLVLGPTCQAAELPRDNSKDYANKRSHITGWGRTSGIVKGAGIAQWLERRARDQTVVGSNPCRSGGIFGFSRVNFLC